MIKKQRQEIIIDLIKNNEISTQEILKKYLENAGIAVTQATLSRDINELNLKKDLSGFYKYAVPLRIRTECPGLLKESVTEILHAMNIAVIKCRSGMAQAACATLDSMQCMEIIGTIAGDDTIFAVTASEKDAVELCQNLKAMIGNNSQ